MRRQALMLIWPVPVAVFLQAHLLLGLHGQGEYCVATTAFSVHRSGGNSSVDPTSAQNLMQQNREKTVM